MDLHLEPQFKNVTEIKSILKQVKIQIKLADEREVNTLLVYLPIDEGKSIHSDLFEKIKDNIMTNFVFSCREIEKKLNIKNKSTPEQLLKRAVNKLSQHTAQGELGELLLFTLLDVYYQAPKLLSKISLKTSRRVAVFGADAVHGQFTKDGFVLYLGESKLHQRFKGASKSAAQSLANLKKSYTQELDLLESHIDFPNINDEVESHLLNLLNPYSESDTPYIIHTPCFIGFAEKDLISSANTESEFQKAYINIAKEYTNHFFHEVIEQKLDISEISILMLPFSSLESLVSEFISFMEIEV